MSELQLKQVDYEATAKGYEVVTGEPTSLRGLYAPDIDYGDLQKRFKEGNDTYEVVQGADRPYEIAVFNADKLHKARILKPSTSFSSLYKNPGNALEVALAATANPEAAYIYIASFGNHPTGHMPGDERRYLAKTGRYTTGDGSETRPYAPLGSVEDMAEMLVGKNYAPTHLSADAEAGRLAVGLMSALPKDTIKGAYLNGIDGISPTANYEQAKLSEDLKSRIERRRVTDSKPGEVTPVNIKDVKKNMPNIYSGLGRIAHLAPLTLFIFPRDVRDKIYATLGFRGHADLKDLDTHAVYQDMSAAFAKQNTMVTMQFNTESGIHDLAECIEFGREVMDRVGSTEEDNHRQVRLLIGEGTLDRHTDKPHDQARIEGYALPDIMQRMSKLAGGLALESHIFGLTPVRKSA